MSEISVTAITPISGWDPTLQAIVRCLEAMDSEQKTYERRHWTTPSDPLRYDGLIAGLESFLTTQKVIKGTASSALAELSIGTGFIPPERGLRYLLAAAEDGYLVAQLELARLADKGELLPLEYWEWKRDGRYVSNERWDSFNRDESDRWWKAAAENGSAAAQYQMSCGLIDSDDPEKFTEGVRWLEKAAYQQSPSVGAQFDLAYMMDLGNIVPNSPEERWHLYSRAAQGGVEEAMLAAGHYLENGIGVEQDDKGAIKWYLRAAERGLDEGYLLAGLLSGSDEHLEKAANAGHVAAMALLARRKLNGGLNPYGFESFRAGLGYFQDAAARDNLEAVLELADIYESGWQGHSQGEWWMQLGLENEIDRVEQALAYYEQAVELGCEWAAKDVDRLRRRMAYDHQDMGDD